MITHGDIGGRPLWVRDGQVGRKVVSIGFDLKGLAVGRRCAAAV